MTTLEMEIALMTHLGVRRNIVVPNVHWGIDYSLHECDLLCLTKARLATEVEIKISKADLLKDKEKNHNHSHPLIKRTFFAVPEKLKDLAVAELDQRFGVLVVRQRYNRYFVEEVRKAKINSKAKKWDDELYLKLLHLGCMRIMTLKKQLLRSKK